MKRKVEDWSVEQLNKERTRITFPEYQREKSLWPNEKKSMLIDSILREIDIPKLYFNVLKDKSIEVVDGQQRLWSIWEFLDDLYPYRTDGKGQLFSRISPAQQARILGYDFQVTEFQEADEDYLRELFVRLQLGLLLNAGEKLHAATGKMKNLVFGKLAVHPFIRHLGISERRYAKETLCAQICINSFTKAKLDVFSRTRYDDLLHFFNEYEDPRGKDLELFNKQSKRILDILNSAVGLRRGESEEPKEPLLHPFNISLHRRIGGKGGPTLRKGAENIFGFHISIVETVAGGSASGNGQKK